ncbi:hypothetical protein AMTRI_Chr08g204760 [Amborella trichopoda]
MMATTVPGQQTLNYKSELVEINDNALAYQNIIIIFLAFSINIPADENFIFLDDIVACRGQFQRVYGLLVVHLWVCVGE